MKEEHLEIYLSKISSLKSESNKIEEDNPGSLMRKIELLAECLVYIGSVSAYVDKQYEVAYANRKYEQAKSHVSHAKDKAANSEIDVRELRLEENNMYGDKMRWRNAFESTKEQINVLKMKMKVNFHLGDNDSNR